MTSETKGSKLKTLRVENPHINRYIFGYEVTSCPSRIKMP